MKIKYENQSLLIKDLGLGLGVFKWCTELSIQVVQQ